MESGSGFPFGGDPEELMRGLREFTERQAEVVHASQREQFATLTLNTAVELTAAALQQLHMEGSPDLQAATSSVSQSSGRPSWSPFGTTASPTRSRA
jgi:hypothetical protein